MKAPRVLFVSAASAVVLTVLAGGAQAQDGVAAGTSAAQCVRGCSLQKRDCVATGRTTSLACKLTCRETSPRSELGTCMRGCSTAFRDTKDACRATQKACIVACRTSTPMNGAAPVDAGCFGSCGSDLGDCARDVVTAGRTCVKGCRDTDDRLDCLQGCGADAVAGGEACGDAFAACGTSCPAP